LSPSGLLPSAAPSRSRPRYNPSGRRFPDPPSDLNRQRQTIVLSQLNTRNSQAAAGHRGCESAPDREFRPGQASFSFGSEAKVRKAAPLVLETKQAHARKSSLPEQVLRKKVRIRTQFQPNSNEINQLPGTVLPVFFAVDLLAARPHARPRRQVRPRLLAVRRTRSQRGNSCFRPTTLGLLTQLMRNLASLQ